MEEDIKILEEFIKNYKEVQEKYKDDEIQAEIERSCYFEEVPAQAIEHLIARNKELEQNYMNPSKARFTYFDNGKGTKVVIEGFIPKSKIEKSLKYIDKMIRGINSNHLCKWTVGELICAKTLFEELLEN